MIKEAIATRLYCTKCDVYFDDKSDTSTCHAENHPKDKDNELCVNCSFECDECSKWFCDDCIFASDYHTQMCCAKCIKELQLDPKEFF